MQIAHNWSVFDFMYEMQWCILNCNGIMASYYQLLINSSLTLVFVCVCVCVCVCYTVYIFPCRWNISLGRINNLHERGIIQKFADAVSYFSNSLLRKYQSQREKTYLLTCSPNEDYSTQSRQFSLSTWWHFVSKCAQWTFWSGCANA